MGAKSHSTLGSVERSGRIRAFLKLVGEDAAYHDDQATLGLLVQVEEDFAALEEQADTHERELIKEMMRRTKNDARIAELEEQLESALEVVRAAEIAYDGFGEDDHRFYGSQKRLAEALDAWRKTSNPASVQVAPQPGGEAEESAPSGRPAPESNEASSPEDVVCKCGGKEAGDINFDRSICACGAMHYYCNRCGWPCEPCDESNEAMREES